MGIWKFRPCGFAIGSRIPDFENVGLSQQALTESSSQISVRRQAFLSWRAFRSGPVSRLWGSAASFRRLQPERRWLLDAVRVFQSSVLLFAPLLPAQPQEPARGCCSRRAL